MKKHILIITLVTAILAGCKHPNELPDINPAYCPSAITIQLGEREQGLLYVDEATGVQTLPMLVGERIQLGWTIEPDTATFSQVIWKSSSEDNIIVDNEGTIEAKSAVGLGYSIVSVTPVGMFSGSGVSASLRIKVSAKLLPASGLIISPVEEGADSSIFIGDKLPLSASILPAEATYHTVSWKSLNEDIATVDAEGVVTGVSTHNALNATAVIVAMAKDGSGVEAHYTVRVKNVVDPEKVTLGTEFCRDNYVCCMYDKAIKLSYTTYPEECTVSKIEWTCSDPELATVVDGIVYFNQNGHFGDFTITATCPNGQSDQIVLTMPAGLIRENFQNENNLTWGIENMDKLVWHPEGYVTCTTSPMNDTNQRADFQAKSPVYICAGNYPIIMFRMDYVMDKYEEVTFCAFKFDTSGNDDKDNKYWGEIGGGDKRWKHRWFCEDGSNVFIYDLTTQGCPNGGILPPTSIVRFTTFQIKYADMRPLNHEIEYNVYGVQTFHNIEEVRDYLKEQNVSWTE